MRSSIVLILLAVFLAFSTGLASAETPMVIAGSKDMSRFEQLSDKSSASTEILGKNLISRYQDVTKAADVSSVFSREPGVPIPSVKVEITNVNAIGEKWVEITNQAIGPWDLTGWKLASAGNATYTFPQFALNSSTSVKVHEGNVGPTPRRISTPMPPHPCG